MKVLSRTSDGLKRCYNVWLSPEELDIAREEKLKDVASKVKLPGFRPGKVPIKIIAKRYGSSVEAEVQEKLVNESAYQILKEAGRVVPNYTQINELSDDDKKGIEFELKFEMLPDFELMDFSKIELVKHVADIPENKVMELLEQMRAKVKDWQELTGNVEIEEGHRILVNLTLLTNVDGVKEHRSADQTVDVGDTSLVDDFWKHFVGCFVGDTIEFDIKYPEDFSEKSFAGKVIHYSAVIKKIFEGKDYEIDDHLAQALGFKDLEDAKSVVAKQEQQQCATISMDLLKRDLLYKISDAYTFEVPESLWNTEEKVVFKQIEAEAVRMGKAFTDDIKLECRKLAADRVRLGLIIADVAKQEKLTISKSEIYQSIAEFARTYDISIEDAIKRYNASPALKQLVMGPIIEGKVVDFLINKIKITEEKCSVEKLIELDEEPFDFFKDDYKGPSQETKKLAKSTEKAEEKSADKPAKSKAVKADKSEKATKAETAEKPAKKAESKPKKVTAKKPAAEKTETEAKEEAPKKKIRKKAE